MAEATAKDKAAAPKVTTGDDDVVTGTALDGLSRQSQFASKSEVSIDTDENPPPGPQVEETLGKPSKGPVPASER